MEADENRNIDDFIKELKDSFFFRTLIPKNKDRMYYADIKFARYIDLIYTVQDLLKIALHTLYNDGLENSGQIADPASHLISVLEIAIQLLPCSEAEGLDKLHKLYVDLQKDQESGNEKLDVITKNETA